MTEDNKNLDHMIKDVYGQPYQMDEALIDKMVASITAPAVVVILQRPIYRFSIMILFMLFGLAGFLSGVENAAQIQEATISVQAIEQIFLTLDGDTVL